MMAGLNVGILLLSQLARVWPVTPDSWRWIFRLSGIPAVLGILVLVALPESPEWLQSRLGGERKSKAPLRDLFQPGLIGFTLASIVISSIPMVGAWAASKWMIPWADKVASANASYKAETQGWWAIGATIGSILGAQLASRLGRRRSYLLISAGATVLTVSMFQLTAPLQSGFHAVVFAQGLVATLFFGWLALYLPELFPVQVRATGSGLAYNFGRFATAGGVLGAGFLFTSLGGDYQRVGTVCAMIYALGIVAVWLVREPTQQ
jgi:MFS transporter, SHS family, sialic acid transporter